MKLTYKQYDQLLDTFVSKIVDGMDTDTLIQFAKEQMELNLRKNFPIDEELIEEISRFNDESDVAAMLEDVGANPADFGVRMRTPD
jgi:hypothetical protein